MPFLDHLEELRWHLIRSILAILIAGGAAFLAKDFIFDVLLFGPKKQDFVKSNKRDPNTSEMRFIYSATFGEMSNF